MAPALLKRMAPALRTVSPLYVLEPAERMSHTPVPVFSMPTTLLGPSVMVAAIWLLEVSTPP